MPEDRDIVDVLLEDHEEFRSLFAELETVESDQREQLFSYAVERLASHEAAEAALVHRTVRDDVPDGKEVAEARLEEEASAEELLKEMTKMDPASQEFATKVGELKSDVLEHAEHEEHEEFPKLREHIDDDRRLEMGRRFQALREGGPSRPHPGAPQSPEVRAIAGPLVGAFDRARDAVRDAFSD